MNQVSLVGRIARDPELRYTPAGKAVCHLTVAIDRGFGDNKAVDWLPVTTWEQQAEFAANHLTKGRLVSIEGRLQSRTYETKEGEKRTGYDVVAHRIQGLGPKPADEPESRQTQSGAPEPPPEPNRPTKPAPDLDPNDPFAEQG